jgi:hypothetical protein
VVPLDLDDQRHVGRVVLLRLAVEGVPGHHRDVGDLQPVVAAGGDDFDLRDRHQIGPYRLDGTIQHIGDPVAGELMGGGRTGAHDQDTIVNLVSAEFVVRQPMELIDAPRAATLRKR